MSMWGKVIDRINEQAVTDSTNEQAVSATYSSNQQQAVSHRSNQ
jgi:hypothetical protein